MVQIRPTPQTHPKLDELVRRLEFLPSAPRVLPKLKQLLSDGNSATHHVVELILLDPGISARVLQFGNSAYFSQGVRCYTVEEAVGRVGYDQIYELVSTAVASQVLERPLLAYGLEADALWQRSVACAVAAELLADHLNVDRKIAYTIGLLHSIGMIAIDDWLSIHRPGLRLVSEGMPLEYCTAEREAVGFHQAETGAALLRLWDFPQVMSEPVRWQYLPKGTAAYFRFAALLHVAKAIGAQVLDPAPSCPHWSGNTSTLLQHLGIPVNHIKTLAKAVDDRLRAINQQLLVEESRVLMQFPAGERGIPLNRSGRVTG